jgi:5-methylcytosine-specific restriction endonuclease McrA
MMTPQERHESHLASARKYDRAHRAEASIRQRNWPWLKAASSAKQTRRRARAFGIAEGVITKEVMARLHLLPCAYCGTMPALEADHVLPFRFGGQNVLANLVPCCPTCNRRRGAYVFNAIQGKSSPARDLWPETVA